MMILTAILLTVVVTATSAPDASTFVGPPKGTPLTGEQLEHRTNEVGGLLRCPVCQGLSVADSPAQMAVNMKGQVRELLARGFTEKQILSYFEQSYGQFVLLEPKFEGINLLVWLLPLAAVIGGALIIRMKMRTLAMPAAAPKPQQNTTADDRYLAQVRDLVAGGKS